MEIIFNQILTIRHLLNLSQPMFASVKKSNIIEYEWQEIQRIDDKTRFGWDIGDCMTVDCNRLVAFATVRALEAAADVADRDGVELWHK